MMMNEGVQVTEASEFFRDDHVRSMVYVDNERDLIIPIYVASFGNPIEQPKGANLMYPPIEDDGYLCTLPSSFQNLPKADAFTNGARHNQMSIALFVKFGGNCTAQQKAEVMYEIQQYYPNVDMLLIYSTTEPPDRYDYDDQPTLLMPDTTMVSNMFDDIGILYVKYADGVKITNEIKHLYQTKTTIYENKSAHFYPDLYNNRTTEWTFNFFVSGQPDSYYDNGNPNSYISSGNTEDENPTNFFWFRFVLFGLLIIAPLIRAVYLWYAGGGRIYLRRHAQTGRIIGLQYIPPIASWLAIGPTRLQQPSTPILDVISEEDFNNLPEIIYAEPIVVTKHDAEEQYPTTPKANDKLCVECTTDTITKSNPRHSLPLDNIIYMDQQHDELNTSFNSAAEKGIIGIDDSEYDINSVVPITLMQQDNNKNNETDSKNNNTVPVANSGTFKSNIDSNIVQRCTDDANDLSRSTATTTSSTTSTAKIVTTCTACSICIDDFEIGETLTLLPRYAK